jgi:hypothetical protein
MLMLSLYTSPSYHRRCGDAFCSCNLSKLQKQSGRVDRPRQDVQYPCTHAGERTGRVTCHLGFHLHGLTPQRCMRTRRVYYDHGLRNLVLRRTTSVDVGGETNPRSLRSSASRRFVVAKLLVGTPTPAGGSVSDCISIGASNGWDIGKTIRLGFLMADCIFCSIALIACVDNIR